MAALTYLAGFVTGIVFLVLDPYKSNSFIRFHAFQSIFFNVAPFTFLALIADAATDNPLPARYRIVAKETSEAHAAYNRLYPMYKKLYTEVQHHFEELAKMDLPQVWITKENQL